jgi:protein-S-isoprenylcysteine O-methyltransferase Ste14
MKSAQGHLAVAMPVVLFGATAALGVVASRHVSGVAHVRACFVLCTYWAWIAFETTLSIRERGERSPQDRGTLQVYALGQGLTALSALAFFRTAPTSIVAWTGAVAFLLGAALRIYAIRTLGSLYSHRVRVQLSHRIVSHGPYRWVRHPAYAGMLLAHLGFVLVFFNWVALGAFLFLLLPGVVVRIVAEEKALLSLEGYAEYCSQRRRLLPLVW